MQSLIQQSGRGVGCVRRFATMRSRGGGDRPRRLAGLPRGKLGRLAESMLLSQGQRPPDKSRHEQATKVEIDTSRLSDSAIMALPIPSAQEQQMVMSFGTVIQALRSTQSPQDDRITKDIAGIASNVDPARTEFRNGDVITRR